MAKRPPAMTPEQRDSQVIADAYDLAEKKIRDGTASSQLILHFLRMGSRQNQLELELMEQKKELAAAQAENYRSSQRMEDLYKDAITAMQRYSGYGDDDVEEL